MNRWNWLPLVFCVFAWFSADVQATKDNLPRLPGAALLAGYSSNLSITAPRGVLNLSEAGKDAGCLSMSLDGKFVVACRKSDPASYAETISVYAADSKSWTDYIVLPGPSGGFAISPDGSRLAFAAQEGPSTPFRIHVADLKTRTETLGPEIGPFHWGLHATWSPDGRRIAFDIDLNRTPESMIPRIPTLRPAIHVLDLDTGRITKIADGWAPAWAPSGELIAFLHYSEDKENVGLGTSRPNANQACLVHPDGTGFKIVATVRIDDPFMDSPVWSPDSKSILLSKTRDDLITRDIFLLDLAALKMTKIFKGTLPVYGWAEAK
jgi:Tol biopolymer transport system component